MVRDRRTVQSHERALRAIRRAVDILGDNLLSGPGLSRNQHRGAGGGSPLSPLDDRHHRGVAADKGEILEQTTRRCLLTNCVSRRVDGTRQIEQGAGRIRQVARLLRFQTHWRSDLTISVIVMPSFTSSTMTTSPRAIRRLLT